MNMSILITSASKKVWLVEAFKRALIIEKDVTGKVIAADKDPLSAALYVSDKNHLVPSYSDRRFISDILEICKRYEIKLIIPTADKEFPIFAKNRSIFNGLGIAVMVSDPDVIETCSDKYKLYQFLNKNNIPAPRTILPAQINFSSVRYPLIVKPRIGSGGSATFKVSNIGELKFFVSYVNYPIIQEFVNGKEYTVDLFSDFNKKVLTVLPRERIQTVSGESYKSKTVKDWDLINLAKHTAEKLGATGHITLQFIKGKDSFKLIEINPRYGGGANLGFKAGHNTPSLLIKLVKGEKVRPAIGKFRKNFVMLRYTEDLFLENSEIIR